MRLRTRSVQESDQTRDVRRLSDGSEAAFGRAKAGPKALVRWLATGAGRVIFEPTVRYHLALERHLAETGYPLVKVNPRQAKRFGEAGGYNPETDRADAAMLARMGVALELEPQSFRLGILHDLNGLISARRTLVKDRTAAKNRAKELKLAILRQQNAAWLKRIEADLDALDAAIQALI